VVSAVVITRALAAVAATVRSLVLGSPAAMPMVVPVTIAFVVTIAVHAAAATVRSLVLAAVRIVAVAIAIAATV
jgi:hypothetical protein